MAFIKVLRVKQWSKNLVILIPIILSKSFDIFFNYKIYLIILSFSLLVSSTYIFNDIRDLDQDRIHPKKQFRPIASGKISVIQAKVYGLLLLIASIAMISIFEYRILSYSLIYLAITTLYSISLKYLKYFDILTISILFYLRIMIGGVSGQVGFTNYFILFIISVLSLISLGKKISIFKDPNIPVESRVKFHLIENYSEETFNKLLYLFSTIAFLTYAIWLRSLTAFTIFNLINSFIAIIFLILFLNLFTNDSRNYKTENFIEWASETKNLLVALTLSITTLITIY